MINSKKFTKTPLFTAWAVFGIILIVLTGAKYIEERNIALYGGTKSSDFEQNSLNLFERPGYRFNYPTFLEDKYDEKNNKWSFESNGQQITLVELPKDKRTDKAVLLTQTNKKTELTETEEVVINGRKVTQGMYWMVNENQRTELGDEGNGYLPAYGYVVSLPNSKLFLFQNGELLNKEVVTDIILLTLREKDNK